MTKPTTEYSRSFCDPAHARAYEHSYEAGTADEALWRIEREFLAEFYSRNEPKWPRCSYLDFACGTGRVLAFMEAWPAISRGIDISPEMLAVARTKIQRSELVCMDITKEGPPEDRYDLITAFRFFLNAEPELRLRVLKALALRLRNADSRLVFNNHGNPFSYKAAAWPLHRTRQLFHGRAPAGNYLTHREVKELVRKADLQIVERTGCGLISPKVFKLAPSEAGTIESWFGRNILGRTFGVDQIYVVARR
jgi:SAM-dependent methyltransferase